MSNVGAAHGGAALGGARMPRGGLPGSAWFKPWGWTGAAFEMKTDDGLVAALKAAGVRRGLPPTGQLRDTIAESAATEAHDFPSYASRHEPPKAAAAAVAAPDAAVPDAVAPDAAPAPDSDTSLVGDEEEAAEEDHSNALFNVTFQQPCDVEIPDAPDTTLAGACCDIASSVVAFKATSSTSPAGQHSWLPARPMSLIATYRTHKSIVPLPEDARERIAADLRAAGALIHERSSATGTQRVLRMGHNNTGGDAAVLLSEHAAAELRQQWDEAQISGAPTPHALEALVTGRQGFHGDAYGATVGKSIMSEATGVAAGDPAGILALHVGHVRGIFSIEQPASYAVSAKAHIHGMGASDVTGTHWVHSPVFLPQRGFRLMTQSRLKPGIGPSGTERFVTIPLLEWPPFRYAIDGYEGEWVWRFPSNLDTGGKALPRTVPRAAPGALPTLAVQLPPLGDGIHSWGRGGRDRVRVSAARYNLIAGMLAGSSVGLPLSSFPQHGVVGQSTGAALGNARTIGEYASSRSALDAFGFAWLDPLSSEAQAASARYNLIAGMLAGSSVGLPLSSFPQHGVVGQSTGAALGNARTIGEYASSRSALDAFGFAWLDPHSPEAQAASARYSALAGLLAGTSVGLSVIDVADATVVNKATATVLHNTRGHSAYPTCRPAFDALGVVWKH